MTRRSLALALSVALCSSTLEAQFARTGQSTTTTCPAGVSLCDPNWSVRWFDLDGGGGGGFLSNAWIIPDVGGIWAPNQTGVQQWIGAASGGTVGTGSTRYYFQTAFTQSASGVVDLGLGWDNRLVGAYVGGSIDLGTGLFIGGVSLLPGTSPASPYAGGSAGFCRNGDGVFPSSQYPNCVLNVALSVNANQQNVLTFVVEGDGGTDGLLVGLATGTNEPPIIVVPPPLSTTVPEPSTYALMAAGLGTLALVSRRRRRDPGARP